MSNLNKAAKKRQNIIAIIIVSFSIVFFVLFLAFHHSKRRSHAKGSPDMTGVVASDFNESNQQSALQTQQEQIDKLTSLVGSLQKDEALTATKHKEYQEAQKLKIKSLEAKIKDQDDQIHANASQAKKLEKTSKKESLGIKNAAENLPLSAMDPLGESVREPGAPLPSSMHISVSTIDFKYSNPKVDGLNPNTYVPSGTFARAILLQGADANASVNGQSNTSPILLRILDNGTLPNGKHSSLKGCFVLGSIYGDISSERGEVRLTSISCTKTNGEILDEPVQGYASFAGKEGIKGKPVMRNGKIIAWAGLSGMLSGFGQALQQSQTTQSVSPMGATSTVDSNKTLKFGAFAGVGTAMSKLSDYYIKRADQYHPIIEIGSGNVATIVFQKGFSLKPKKDTEAKDTGAGKQTNAHSTGRAMIPESVLKQIQNAHLGQKLKGVSNAI